VPSRSALTTLLFGLAGPVGFWLLWEALAAVVADDAVLPGPRVVLWAFEHQVGGDRGLAFLGIEHTSYPVNLGWTVGTAGLAWAIGGGSGVVVGLLAARRQWLRDLTEPVLFVAGAVPVLVAAPLLLVWFGTGMLSKLLLVAFYCFVVVALVAQAAALGLPPAAEEYVATLGLDENARFRSVVAPATFPAIVAVLRLGLATGIGLQAGAELLGSRVGVGRLIAVRAQQGDPAAVLALVITLGLVAMLLDLALRVGLAPVLRWQP